MSIGRTINADRGGIRCELVTQYLPHPRDLPPTNRPALRRQKTPNMPLLGNVLPTVRNWATVSLGRWERRDRDAAGRPILNRMPWHRNSPSDYYVRSVTDVTYAHSFQPTYSSRWLPLYCARRSFSKGLRVIFDYQSVAAGYVITPTKTSPHQMVTYAAQSFQLFLLFQKQRA